MLIITENKTQITAPSFKVTIIFLLLNPFSFTSFYDTTKVLVTINIIPQKNTRFEKQNKTYDIQCRKVTQEVRSHISRGLSCQTYDTWRSKNADKATVQSWSCLNFNGVTKSTIVQDFRCFTRHLVDMIKD